jgi:two-component system, NtrC family, sensor kinase
MNKKFFWHIVYGIFIFLCLINIFQKLKWSMPTDGIDWDMQNRSLVCISAPASSSVKKGDILLAVNQYTITDQIDLLRVIAQPSAYFVYDVERDGELKHSMVDVTRRYTPFYYFVLVFCGILFILLALGIINGHLKNRMVFAPPVVFHVLVLSFAGFLIFSPTGEYNLSDFLFLALDQICFTIFPAVLINYTLLFPTRIRILRRINWRLTVSTIYTPPTLILFAHFYALMKQLAHPRTESLLHTINQFRGLTVKYFTIFFFIAFLIILTQNLLLVFRNRKNRYLVPLITLSLAFTIILVFNLLPLAQGERISAFGTVMTFAWAFLPLVLTYFLTRKRFTDIENIIKKTLSISSVFVFILLIYLFLGLNIEENKLLGVFWSVTAILCAGLLFRPLESTILHYVERLFARDTFNFKVKLKELESSIGNQRDLNSLARSFLEIINRGFKLKQSVLLIHASGSTFISMPSKHEIVLSEPFKTDLLRRDRLVFLSWQEFERAYPTDSPVFSPQGALQFLPLKANEKLIGIVAFSRKLDNTYFSSEDWDLLFSIAPSLSLSVENAFLYTELEKQLLELHLLKEFNENIVKNINLGIVVTDQNYIIKAWNHFMEIKLATPANNVLEQPLDKAIGLPLANQIKSGAEQSLAWRNVTLGDRAPSRLFDIYTSPLKDVWEEKRGVIVVLEDVTEKNAIQNQLITSERMASLGLLSAGIAHEINTPLTGISSYCQFILENPAGADNPDLVAKIQEQVQRANKIVRSLLDFSRQKAEHPVRVEINKVLDESFSLIDHQIKKKNIAITKSLVVTRSFWGYPTRLQQLFINLLINAIDAIDDNGEIRIQGAEIGDTVEIRLSDNGKGIKEANLDKIFDPFFTTKTAGRGTGLGLSIVYNIIKEHYGTITVASQAGRGTAFTITFPFISPLRSLAIHEEKIDSPS